MSKERFFVVYRDNSFFQAHLPGLLSRAPTNCEVDTLVFPAGMPVGELGPQILAAVAAQIPPFQLVMDDTCGRWLAVAVQAVTNCLPQSPRGGYGDYDFERDPRGIASRAQPNAIRLVRDWLADPLQRKLRADVELDLLFASGTSRWFESQTFSFLAILTLLAGRLCHQPPERIVIVRDSLNDHLPALVASDAKVIQHQFTMPNWVSYGEAGWPDRLDSQMRFAKYIEAHFQTVYPGVPVAILAANYLTVNKVSARDLVLLDRHAFALDSWLASVQPAGTWPLLILPPYETLLYLARQGRLGELVPSLDYDWLAHRLFER